MPRRIPRRRACLLSILACGLLHGSDAAAQSNPPLLSEALRALQARGVRIVFSSATVTPDMHVLREPRSSASRQQLEELLAPHGLQARPGPAGILEIVRRARDATQPAQPSSAPPATVTTDVATVPPIYHHYVTVTAVEPYRIDRGVASEVRVDRSTLDRLHGAPAGDPFDVVRMLPGASAVDDFRSELTMRGSAVRHADVVVDGVSAQWLQHTALGRGATGSLSMLPVQALESVTLRAGAYPRRHADRLGPQVDFILRDGSRTEFGLRGAVGSTSASLLGEGPLGVDRRGSWLVAARQSLIEWPAVAVEESRTAFDFSDALAKLAYDVAPGQQLALTLFGGRSSVDLEDTLVPGALADGENRAVVTTVAWRAAVGSSMALRQQASMMRHRFVNREQDGSLSDRIGNEEIVYRADLTRALGWGLLETGARVGLMGVKDVARLTPAPPVSSHSWQRSAYVHAAWAARSWLTVSPGLRLTKDSSSPQPTSSHWLLAEWAVTPAWSVHGSVGASSQTPAPRQIQMAAPAMRLTPERARYIDAAVEQRLGRNLRWQATVFLRRERDILRLPEEHPRGIGEDLVGPEPYAVNALVGSARGIELLIEGRSVEAMSGWASYSFGRVRYYDPARGESFPGDFDQRHALTLAGNYPIGTSSTVGATLRLASNFPVPGYLTQGSNGLAAGGLRNQVRLPAYARLDLRAERAFSYVDRRFTVYAEVLNTLDRRNAGASNGSVEAATGAATGFINRLSPRRASAGLIVEF